MEILDREEVKIPGTELVTIPNKEVAENSLREAVKIPDKEVGEIPTSQRCVQQDPIPAPLARQSLKDITALAN